MLVSAPLNSCMGVPGVTRRRHTGVGVFQLDGWCLTTLPGRCIPAVFWLLWFYSLNWSNIKVISVMNSDSTLWNLRKFPLSNLMKPISFMYWRNSVYTYWSSISGLDIPVWAHVAWARTLVESCLMVSIELLVTLIALSDAARCNIKRQVPVESSKIILYLGELDLVS